MFTELVVNVEDEIKKYKEYAEKIRPMVANTTVYLHKAAAEKKTILIEGANAAMLDIDFGKYLC